MSGSPSSGAWLTSQADRAERLAGKVITGWTGVEMAITEDTGTGAEFGHDDADCVQLLSLTAMLADGTAASFTTYQDDCLFGQLIGDSDPAAGRQWTGIYRARHLAEFPAGPVSGIRLHAEQGTHAELLLMIAGRKLLLIAGEICGAPAGALEWHRFDESVLAFTSTAAADRVPWTPARAATATWTCS